MFVPPPGPDSDTARALADEHGGSLTGVPLVDPASPVDTDTAPGTSTP